MTESEWRVSEYLSDARLAANGHRLIFDRGALLSGSQGVAGVDRREPQTLQHWGLRSEDSAPTPATRRGVLPDGSRLNNGRIDYGNHESGSCPQRRTAGTGN